MCIPTESRSALAAVSVWSVNTPGPGVVTLMAFDVTICMYTCTKSPGDNIYQARDRLSAHLPIAILKKSLKNLRKRVRARTPYKQQEQLPADAVRDEENITDDSCCNRANQQQALI